MYSADYLIKNVNSFIQKLLDITEATPFEITPRESTIFDAEPSYSWDDFRFVYPNVFQTYKPSVQSNTETNSEPSTSILVASVPELSNITTQSAGNTGISDAMLRQIFDFEGTSWDKPLNKKFLTGTRVKKKGGGYDNSHRTYGYGLLFHPTYNKYMDLVKSTWTLQELLELAIIDMKKRVNLVKNWANKNGITLNLNLLDAIVCAVHNFGQGFLNKQVAKMIIQNPNNPEIMNVWAHMSDALADKNGWSGLKRRRRVEANWYFTGHA